MRKEIMFLLTALSFIVPAALEAQNTATAKTVTFWTPFSGGDGEYFDAMVSVFNSSQKELVMKNTTIKQASYYPRLSAAVSAGSAPDVVVLNQARIVDYSAGEALLVLNDLLEKANIDLSTFEPGPLAGCTIEGRILAVPLDVHPIIMYYNKDLFAKAGISKIPGSLDELVETAKAIQERTGAIGLAADNATATFKAYTLARMFMSFLVQQDSAILDPSNTRAAFDNAAGRKAYAAISDMVNRHKITPKGLEYDFSVSYFKQGKAGIHFNGVWVTGVFEAQKNLNFGSVQFPAAFGKHAAWSGSHALAVPKPRGQNEASILGVMKCIDWITDHGELWAKSGNIPVRKTVLAKAEFRGIPHRAEYADASGSSFFAPAIPKWPACYTAMADSLEESVARNRDAESAVALMAKRINEILSR